MFVLASIKLGSFYIFWLATKLFFATEANFSLHRIKNKMGFKFSKSGRADGWRVRSLVEGGARLC